MRVFVGFLVVGFAVVNFAEGAPWPAWRGDVLGSGVSSETDVPLEWDEKKNVRWRIELPDRGNSTPVIWGTRVFVTQAIEGENWRGLMCFDRADGSLLWKKGVEYAEAERTHKANPYCSASAMTDGERVVASYGSAGVVCYDFEGEELWRRDFGAIDHVWGNSTSPVIHGELCFYYHGPAKGAFLVALAVETGETVWKFDEPDWKPGKRTDGFQGRDDEGIIGSFSTPILVKAGSREELVMSFPTEVAAFDPATGAKLWNCRGLNPLVYTSPVYAEGVVVAMGGYRGNSIGVRVGGKGDVTEQNRLWREVNHNGGIGSGVVKDGYLYYQNSGGIASCLEMKTGKEMWEARLPGTGKSWGSFLRSGDRVYSLSQAGDAVVFEATPEAFRELAVNDLGEMTNSSIAISDGELFIRTHEALWCISDGL